MSILTNIDTVLDGLEQMPLFFPFVKDGKLHYAPNEPMKKVHKKFFEALRALTGHLYSPRQGSIGDPYQNVLTHAGSRYIYKLDLYDAFGQIKPGYITNSLAGMRPVVWNREAIQTFLENFCFEIKMKEYGLMRGAPASPDLFNLAVYPVTGPLIEIAKKYALYYSRYFDDFTVSANFFIHEEIRREIRQVFEEHSLSLNHRKSKLIDLEKGSIVITGLRLDRDGYIAIPTPWKRRFRGLLHKAIRSDEVKREVVEGYWAYFKHIHSRYLPKWSKVASSLDNQIVDLMNQYRTKDGRHVDEENIFLSEPIFSVLPEFSDAKVPHMIIF